MQNLIGHGWAIKRLQSAIARNTLAQSHLFVGPASIGKSTLALALASELHSRHARDPKRAAQLVEQRKHPDLFWLEPEGAGATQSIKVEAVRDLLHALTLTPVESRYRIAVLNNAHLMTDSGTNALLKTLEEPNPSVVIVLIAPGTDAVLPTIASRCQVLNLRLVSVEQIALALRAREVEANRADFVARLARGRVGWALNAVTDEALLSARKERLDQLGALLSANRTQRFAFAEKLAKQEGAEIQAVLDEWQLFWRDVVQLGQNNTAVVLHNSDYRELVATTAARTPVPQAAAILKTLHETQQHLQHNVNTRLALDVLLLKLP
jgi:DNA polymerase-3 subunit delta'